MEPFVSAMRPDQNKFEHKATARHWLDFLKSLLEVIAHFDLKVSWFSSPKLPICSSIPTTHSRSQPVNNNNNNNNN